MNDKLYQISGLCLLFILIFLSDISAQATIEGPSCIVAQKEYQYTFYGNWNDSDVVKICIHGGSIVGTADSCQQGQASRSVRIIWSDSVSGYLNLTAGQDTAFLNVLMTEKLNGGLVDSAFHLQLVGADSIPVPILCSGASGGNCSPVYDYQWQQSTDQMTWADIPGSVSRDISFSTVLTQNSFYRRKVKERESGSVSYSDIASIFVMP